MILTSLKIDSFGCLQGVEIGFQKGLNVILGPNEAGKSTLLAAIEKSLFVSAELSRKDFAGELQRYVPIGGKSSIGMTLEFIPGGDSSAVMLTRAWGSVTESRLTLPGGALVDNEPAIREYIDSVLPAREGTMKSIFITPQSSLSLTIEQLRKQMVSRSVHSGRESGSFTMSISTGGTAA